MMSGDNGEPEPKRQRRDDGVDAHDGDPMHATREQLGRISDPHLQARLLLDYSAFALAPHAKTEDAIDFLFAFLQQNQSMPNGNQEKRERGTEASPSSTAGNSNAVVVAAIVRGLRGLLAIKPSVVEPMIQVDAMGEQLTQCVSVSDDFKLRSNMLHIVVDCLLSAEKLADAETLLNACVQDHDDGVRWICLEGYSLLLEKHYQFDDGAISALIDRLGDVAVNDGSERTRCLAARLVGTLMGKLNELPSWEEPKVLLINALAAMARDSSMRVRRSVAIALRQLGNTSELVWAPLFQKQQIIEDLDDVETLSVAMLNSGAVLNLLEDEDAEVAREASISIRGIAETASWSEELLARAVDSHIDLVVRFSSKAGLIDILKNLRTIIIKWHAVSRSSYPMHLEKLIQILEVLPTTSDVGSQLISLLRYVAVDHDFAATKIVNFLIRCCQSETFSRAQFSDAASLSDSIHSDISHLVEDWCRRGIRLQTSIISNLRAIASSHKPHTLTACYIIVYNAFCAPQDRIRVGATHTTTQKRSPSFMQEIGSVPAYFEDEGCTPSRVASSALIRQIIDAVQRLQAQLRENVTTPEAAQARAPMCTKLVHLCRALYVRSRFPERSRSGIVLLKLMWLAALGSTSERKLRDAIRETLSHLPEATSDITLSPFVSSDSLWDEDMDSTLLKCLVEFHARDLLDALAGGCFDQLAIGSLLEPSIPDLNEAIEVCSQIPFTLPVRCVIYHPPNDAEVFIKMQLPNGEDSYCLLNYVRQCTDRVEAETTISVQLPPFSDPTYISLSICLQAPKLLPQVEAMRYYEISPVSKLLICHRMTPLRHSTNRGM